MRRVFVTVTVLAAVVSVGCRSRHATWDEEMAANARMIELQVDGHGKHKEVEYHISPDRVPAAVREAMDRLHPGGPFDDAEMESHGGKTYYELSRKVGGMEVEAMFTPDGQLHEEEVQIPIANVPGAVQSAVNARLGGGQVTKWEEIRNSKREVIAYHVKMTRGSNKYKMMFGTDATFKGMVREVPAEIEVPVK